MRKSPCAVRLRSLPNDRYREKERHASCRTRFRSAASFSICFMVTIRPSHDEDLAAITKIYSHYVLHSTCTLEMTPPTIDEMARRRADVLHQRLPYLVAEHAGSIIGYAYCSQFKPRAAYRFSVESSIYLAVHRCGEGIGHQLLQALMHEAERLGIRKMIACIGDATNERSIRLHRAAGFTSAGTMKSCGWKFNRWLDVLFMDKAIGQGDTTAPDLASEDA